MLLHVVTNKNSRLNSRFIHKPEAQAGLLRDFQYPAFNLQAICYDDSPDLLACIQTRQQKSDARFLKTT
ncbi:hypothetical protein GH742_09125 [Legionella sp. MW5194]|uniref:hypothetical protein n=1 Tax=Legionella sp. MW5194 TaxID=2662448 RepID=UPI00193CC444|nr:hypothetical protein [Legionella sp. MW5194]QRN04018.1 hypothetical protein GH742_09125 [Legionella sp. MW5194]